MFAVVRTGGKQFRVEPGTSVRVEKLDGAVGDNVELAEVYVGMSVDKAFQSKIDAVLRTRSAHKEVNPSARTLELMGPPDNILYADWAYLSKERAKITEKWNEIFG